MRKRLWDKTEQRAKVPVNPFHKMDALVGAQVVIDYPHHEVHDGNFFICSYYQAAVANGGTINLAGTIPAGLFTHFNFDVAAGGDAYVELLEGPTFTDGGAIVIHNMNRNGPAAPFGALSDTTLGGVFLQLLNFLIPGGRGPNAGGGSGGGRAGVEWITEDSENYAVRATNISGNAKPMSIVITFYPKTEGIG